MPPKTNIRTKASTQSRPSKTGDHPHRTAAGSGKSAEEPAAPVSVGPTIKVSITSTAPAAAGKSFLDALQGSRKTTAPVAASSGVVAASPVVEVAPVGETPVKPVEVKPEVEKTPVAVEPTTSEVAEVVNPPVEEPQPPVVPVKEVEEEQAKEVNSGSVGVVSADSPMESLTRGNPVPVAGAAGVPFSWATDTDDDINFQFHQPSPQFAVEYPEGVLENRAHNITFKVPMSNETLASAKEEIRQERAGLLAERRKLEELRTRLQEEESDLVKLRHQLKLDGEKLQQERLQLRQQQEDFQQQQQQQQQQLRGSSVESPVSGPPAAAPSSSSPPVAKRAHPGGGAPDYGGLPKDWSQPPSQAQEWAPTMAHERWAGEMNMVPGYDLYGGVGGFGQPQRSYNYRSTGPGGMGGGQPPLRPGQPGRMAQAPLPPHMTGGGGGPLQHFNNTRMAGVPGAPGITGGRPPMDTKALNFVGRNPVQQPPFNGYNKAW